MLKIAAQSMGFPGLLNGEADLISTDEVPIIHDGSKDRRPDTCVGNDKGQEIRRRGIVMAKPHRRPRHPLAVGLASKCL